MNQEGTHVASHVFQYHSSPYSHLSSLNLCVSTHPGATAFTLALGKSLGASCARLKQQSTPCTADFPAAYAAIVLTPNRPDSEPIIIKLGFLSSAALPRISPPPS